MISLRSFAIAAVAATSLCLVSNARAEDGYGDLVGQFVVDGEVPKPALLIRKGDPTVKDAATCAAEDLFDRKIAIDPASKGIADVFVYISPLNAKKLKPHPSLAASAEKEIVFDQKNCEFFPRCLYVRTDQKVVVKSNDDIAHNTHTYMLKNDSVNFLVAPKDRKGIPVSFTLAENLPMPVKCDIHPWMKSNWLVLDHPYAAVTDKQGKFKIEKLPAGEHEFRVWHEPRYINAKWKVTVKSGGVTEAPVVKVPLAELQREE